MIIEMGKGEFLFSKGTDEQGRQGLLIRKSDQDYAVGELDHDQAGKSALREDDIFIVIPDLESALILQEQIVAASIEIVGWDKR